MKPIVSVVLGSYNRMQFLPLTIESIRRELVDVAHEIIVVDGGSDDGSLAWLVRQKDIITIVQHNRGEWNGVPIKRRSWGYFMNLTFKAAQGEYVCMLSDDCLVVPGAIKNGIHHFKMLRNQGRNVAALAFFWRDWSKAETYHVGCTLGEKLYVNHGMFLNQALRDVDYIDEDTFFFYNGDGDLCLKLWQKGFEILDSPDSYIEHYPHANLDVRKTNYDRFKHDLKNYLAKWEDIYYDPAQNNVGKIIEKAFIDLTNTGAIFTEQHELVVQHNPKILKPKSWCVRAAQKFQWKMNACIRKLQLIKK
jgi:glycosyltransferase involved in cell wall biosynthesis